MDERHLLFSDVCSHRNSFFTTFKVVKLTVCLKVFFLLRCGPGIDLMPEKSINFWEFSGRGHPHLPSCSAVIRPPTFQIRPTPLVLCRANKHYSFISHCNFLDLVAQLTFGGIFEHPKSVAEFLEHFVNRDLILLLMDTKVTDKVGVLIDDRCGRDASRV